MSKLRIKGSSGLIKVENVYCAGRNYPEHIREMATSEGSAGKAVQIPDEPLIFLKPNTSVVPNPVQVSIPEFKGAKISDNLQNEVELVVVVGEEGISIRPEDAYSHIFGYAVGIDLTLRDIQADLKKKGHPWTLSKGFLNSAPVSDVVRKDNVRNPHDLEIILWVNGALKQNSNTSQMIFRVDYLVHYISSIFGLRKGDLIFTGTPSGVSKLLPGDVVDAEISSVGRLNFKVE